MRRKPKLKSGLAQELRHLKNVSQKLQDSWGISPSIKKIQRILKMLKMSLHCMRKRVAVKPPAQEYQDKKAQLEQLKQLYAQDKLDLYHFDETEFCLIPCVP
jgi:hypothetical protein